MKEIVLTQQEVAQCERLKEIRAFYKLTQGKFADSLGGWTKQAISLYENGERRLSEKIIKAACREFKVSREWLVDGEGEMFERFSPDEKLAAFLGTVLAEADDSPRKQVFRYMETLPIEWYEELLVCLNQFNKVDKEMFVKLKQLVEQATIIEHVGNLLKGIKKYESIDELLKIQALMSQIEPIEEEKKRSRK